MGISFVLCPDYVIDFKLIRIQMKLRQSQGIKKSLFSRFVDAVPGKRIFGLYRFMPFCFLFGAGLEWTMINWHYGEVNFYRTYMKRRALESIEEEKILLAKLKEEKKIESLLEKPEEKQPKNACWINMAKIHTPSWDINVFHVSWGPICA